MSTDTLPTTLFEARVAAFGPQRLNKAANWLNRKIAEAAPTGKDIIEAVEALEKVHPEIRDHLKEYFRSDIYLDEGDTRIVIRDGKVARSFVLNWERRRVYVAYLA